MYGTDDGDDVVEQTGARLVQERKELERIQSAARTAVDAGEEDGRAEGRGGGERRQAIEEEIGRRKAEV